MDKIPPKLQHIIEDFQLCESIEKVELLVQYSDNLLPLPERLNESQEDMEQIHECITPIFVQAESQDGKLFFHFKVPDNAPTVKGFAALMQSALDGSKPEEILSVPPNFYQAMGLQRVISHQRMGGLSAILGHMKKLAMAFVVQDQN